MSRVYVGLSGGVDSAVSAALLKEQRHDVVGAFIKIWQPEFYECTWRTDRLDAMRVAAALEIPFREIDLSEVYKKEVVDTMIRTYEAGETPNPDVLCNQKTKFGAFAKWAHDNGAEMVATGHYAQTKEGKLYRGKDAAKDQSYFLHLLRESELRRTFFPVGGMTKPEVRAAAARFGLPVARKPDSQGLCFVGDVSMDDFLRRYITVAEGDVLNMEGSIIGRHHGAMLYTVGQRHGFTLTRSEEPHYIVRTDIARNTITVSEKKADAAVQEVRLRTVHWIHGDRVLPLSLESQVRYRDRSVRTTLEKRGGAVIARFDTPQIAAPGQSLVFYDRDECLGGAVMDAFVHNES